jgi:hypothetical protein
MGHGGNKYIWFDFKHLIEKRAVWGLDKILANSSLRGFFSYFSLFSFAGRFVSRVRILRERF